MSLEDDIAALDADIRRLQDQRRALAKDLEIECAKLVWQRGKFSVRVENCLRNAGIGKDELTPERVASLSESELARTPNFGTKSLREVMGFLAAHGLRLHP